MLAVIQEYVRRHHLALLALFVALGGTSFAAVDAIGPDGDVDACFNKKSGDLSIQQGGKCDRGEKPVTWSQSGPPGAQGPQGDRGIQGEAGPAGPAGAAGTSGSPDTPQQVLDKVKQVDGPGSALDSDLLDGQQASAFLEPGDAATGDLTGSTFSNPQIATDRVGFSEVAGSASVGVPFIIRLEVNNGIDHFSLNPGRNFEVLDAWSVATSSDAGMLTIRDASMNAITNTFNAGGADMAIARAATIDDAFSSIPSGTSILADGTGSLDAKVFVLVVPE